MAFKNSVLLIVFCGMAFQLFGIDDSTSVKSIKGITDRMLEIISVEVGEEPDWNAYRNLFLPTAQKTSVRPTADANRQLRTNNIEQFIRSVGPLYGRDGFLEYATGLTINEYNGIATAFQTYYSKNRIGTYESTGINCYQLVYADNRWWIASTTFVSEDPDNKIPSKYLNIKSK